MKAKIRMRINLPIIVIDFVSNIWKLYHGGSFGKTKTPAFAGAFVLDVNLGFQSEPNFYIRF